MPVLFEYLRMVNLRNEIQGQMIAELDIFEPFEELTLVIENHSSTTCIYVVQVHVPLQQSV